MPYGTFDTTVISSIGTETHNLNTTNASSLADLSNSNVENCQVPSAWKNDSTPNLHLWLFYTTLSFKTVLLQIEHILHFDIQNVNLGAMNLLTVTRQGIR